MSDQTNNDKTKQATRRKGQQVQEGETLEAQPVDNGQVTPNFVPDSEASACPSTACRGFPGSGRCVG
jgi:hypothetical protein